MIEDGVDLNSLKLHQAGAEIEFPVIFGFVPWRHHVEIVTKCKTIRRSFILCEKNIGRELE